MHEPSHLIAFCEEDELATGHIAWPKHRAFKLLQWGKMTDRLMQFLYGYNIEKKFFLLNAAFPLH